MIEARTFVEAARARGFDWYAGVPCSYLTPFIDYVLEDSSLRYVSMANEGDAVALIAGVALGGTTAGTHGRGIASQALAICGQRGPDSVPARLGNMGRATYGKPPLLPGALLFSFAA